MENCKIISTYTTKEAVEDGSLVRVADGQSKECGIIYPVYLTQAAWSKYVEVPEGLGNEQDLNGRLWDILWMFMHAAKKCEGATLSFKFVCRLNDDGDWEANEYRHGDARLHRLVKLKAVISAQDIDDPSPAIFIMKPSED